MKHPLRFVILTTLLILGVVFGIQYYVWYKETEAVRAEEQRRTQAIESVLSARQEDQIEGTDVDPFGEDGIVRILFIGLDSRAGQASGHCDAIQLIEINSEKETVEITAVPRGTYSPLPFGTGTTSTDYYVSNSCALGGLEYGITNIERILGKKAEYLVIVGFSETFGILRRLDLPTTETVQWLRNRQGYAIGEPQRARNHSTFIKQLLVKYLPSDPSTFDKTFHYIVYKMVKTDLSFAQSELIVSALAEMHLADHPERITLSMKPAHLVQDIPYDPDTIDEHLKETVGRISGWLSKQDYAGKTEAEIQAQLLATIVDQMDDDRFIVWAFENEVWFQVEDDETRATLRWDIMNRYIERVDQEEQQQILADFILEMEHLGQSEWEAKGKALLLQSIEG
jgi:anionic cell wall polymer biosynthesis LytR-Cps2A-Psr (LCP) family protein